MIRQRLNIFGLDISSDLHDHSRSSREDHYDRKVRNRVYSSCYLRELWDGRLRTARFVGDWDLA